MSSASAPTPGRSSSPASLLVARSACKYPCFLTWVENILIASSATTQVEGAERADAAQVAAIPKGENLPPAPIDGSVDKWFFISGAAV